MIFLHLSSSTSLREISNGLRSATGNLNHLGIIKAPSKSSLSYLNEKRTYQLFKDYYFAVLEDLSNKAKFKQSRFKIKSKIFLLDSTTISLCFSMFDWALYRKKKGAVKLHTVLNFDSMLPEYLHISDGKTHDVKAVDHFNLPSGCVVVCDRAYLDFSLLKSWTADKVRFVTRMKKNVKYKVVESYELSGKDPNIIKDEDIVLISQKGSKRYPERLRLITIYNPEKDAVIELVSNNVSWTAETISELYKSRWQIEIFFKEIKQLLKIKSFVGTSFNAVMIQIWTAMITILIMKYLKKIGNHLWSLSNLVAFLRLNLFVKNDLQLWLNNPFETEDLIDNNYPQLSLF